MSIGLVTMFYNEEILAPLFLNHYSFVDDIHVIMDEDTTDRTEEICRQFPVTIHKLKFPNMMDAGIKQTVLNELFYSLKTEWGIMVDADEFIFSLKESIPNFLSETSSPVIHVKLWQVYRHVTDSDINHDSVLLQRRHGDPDFNSWYNKHYIKNCISKIAYKIPLNIGCHVFYPLDKITDFLQGAHWKMADPELAIIRRIKNGKERMSKKNLSMNWQCHDFHITEEDIYKECEAHKNDPLLF
jgi:hypothetical protein